jgi:hypothetical protein
MTILITLTIAGADSGPFDLYSDLDGYISAFETGISKSSLLSGYSSALVPNGTTNVRVKSTGVCVNYIDIVLTTPTTTTTTTTIFACNTWYYNVTKYTCACVEIANQTLISATQLTIGKFYYVDFLGEKVRVNSVDFPCDDSGNGAMVNLGSESATCAGVICPTTTTTTTTIAPSSLESGAYSSISEALPMNVCLLTIDTNCWINTSSPGVITTGDIVYSDVDGLFPIVGGNQFYKMSLVSDYTVSIDNVGTITVNTICS